MTQQRASLVQLLLLLSSSSQRLGLALGVVGATPATAAAGVPALSLQDSQQQKHPPWVRGVNIGGWLVMERFITPYAFALTTCHLRGEFCLYPGQDGNNNNNNNDPFPICDMYHCKPVQFLSATGELDYPVDMYTMLGAFHDKLTAKRWLEHHWEHFVTISDVKTLYEAGVTHVRVPLPFWIRGDIQDDEPWVDGGWLYFVRFVSWCRQYNIQVWPDIHTAPSSQNGFDNSGQLLPGPTCSNWGNSDEHIERTLKAVQDISQAIMDDGLGDVVTGFGTLNEPFVDCSDQVLRDYNEKALKILRTVMGPKINVYVGDLFNSTRFADGWWTEKEYQNTYLDSHYYHVFAERPRALSPRQHIAYVCEKNARDANACCYENPPHNTIPSKGISRLFGEWSASFDTLVVSMLDVIMKGIAANGTAPFFDRKISNKRKAFLLNFVQAQMVTYEAAGSGWFYWTLKTEGGAFAEWNFLRGLKEGWIPKIPPSNVSSVDLYGTCENIIFRTKDDMDIVHEFPDPTSLDPNNNWQGVVIDDDVVVSHGNSLLRGKNAPEKEANAMIRAKTTPGPIPAPEDLQNDDVVTTEDDVLDHVVDTRNFDSRTEVDKKHGFPWVPFFFICFLAYGVKRVFFGGNPLARLDRQGYSQVGPMDV